MFYYNDFKFDEYKNYLIYYRGNFGMPTAGHFSLVKKYIDLPNVKYFIHQIGSEKRHGIPYFLNRRIWKIYISELLPKEKIILRKVESSLEILKYIRDIDEVILIKGNEEINEEKEKDLEERYSHLRKSLRRKKVKFHFLIIDRPLLNQLSATKFTEAIKNDLPTDYFMPKDLPEKAKEYIVRKLKEYI